MGDLIKRLFWPRRDYVRVFYNYDEDFVNEFLRELNSKGGKVVKLDDVSITSLGSTIIETEYQSGVYQPGVESSLQEKLVIHYRCFTKINYLSEKEKKELELAEKQRIKNLKIKSKVCTYNLKKKYQREWEEKRILNENKKQ